VQAGKSVCIFAFFDWGFWIPGAFDRWELIPPQELHSKLRIKQNVQKLNSDISDITAWLERTEEELEILKTAKPPSNIHDMELRVKRLQVSWPCGRGRIQNVRACESWLCWADVSDLLRV
jgi:hypothetical protein